MSAALSKARLFNYSFIALPLAFAGLPIYIHIPDYYARELGTNLGLLGVILLSIRLFDAFQDPLIGYLSDKNHQQRHHLIILGMLMLLLGMAGLLYGPQLTLPSALWFGIWMMIATTGFSIVSINLNCLGGFWQKSKIARTRISAWRESFSLIGLLLASILPTALQKVFEPSIAMQSFFWLFALLLTYGLWLFIRFWRDFLQNNVFKITHQTNRFRLLSFISVKDRSFFLIYFLSQLAASIPAALVLLFIRDYLFAEAYTGLFLLLYFLSGAIMMPIWIKLSAKIGLSKSWFVSMLLSVITFIGALSLEAGDIAAYALICILSGTALGADLALPPAILALKIEAEQKQSQATQHYALLSLLPKISIALASGLSLIALNQLGFKPAAANEATALNALLITYALIPCMIKLICAGLLWRTMQYEHA